MLLDSTCGCYFGNENTHRHLDILYKLYYSAYHNKCRLHTHTCPPSLWFFCLVSRMCHFDHCTSVKLAAILQLSQYCTFDGDSISTVITEPGQPVKSSSPRLHSTLSSTNKILAVGQQVQRYHSICIFCSSFSPHAKQVLQISFAYK